MCSITSSFEYTKTMAVLQLLINPHDDNALFTILDSTLTMRAGIGAQLLNVLRAQQSALPLGTPLWSVITTLLEQGTLATRAHGALRRFVDWWTRVHHKVMFMALPDVLLYVWKESGILLQLQKEQSKSTASPSKPNAARQAPSPPGLTPQRSHGNAVPLNSPLQPAHSGQAASDAAGVAQAPQTARLDGVPEEREVLINETLTLLHRLAKSFYDEWNPAELVGGSGSGWRLHFDQDAVFVVPPPPQSTDADDPDASQVCTPASRHLCWLRLATSA